MVDTSLAAVKKIFSYLFENYGFRLIEKAESESFGNSYAVIESDDFRLQFIIDRGQSFVEISPYSEPREWFDLNIMRAYILGTDSLQIESPEELSEFLKCNYKKIKDLFSSDNILTTVAQLKQLEKDRARRMFS